MDIEPSMLCKNQPHNLLKKLIYKLVGKIGTELINCYLKD